MTPEQEAEIAARMVEFVEAENKKPSRKHTVTKGSQKHYPEIVRLFPGHDALAVAQVAAVIGENITTTENRLSSLVVRGLLRVEYVMHEGRLMKGHVRADAPLKPEGQLYECKTSIKVRRK